jgi:hypothetical protein
MARRPSPAPLTSVKLGGREQKVVPPAPPERREPAPRNPSRQGKRAISIWISPEAFQQLGFLAVETGRDKQALMEEALDHLFAAFGKQRIAASR